MNKYLIALPIFLDFKGFNCQTILVKAKNRNDAISKARHLKPYSYIGDIKLVNY